MSNKSSKVKVPGGAFYAGDGLTVDPMTRTVSAGGGDVTTPDWNQNDETASDYIKNRPFYTGDPVKTEIIPATTVTFSEMEGLMAATWPESFDLVDGQTYYVSWDGTDYVCTGILFNGTIPILGNLGILGDGPDTGEPFIFFNRRQWLVASTESATDHVIAISEYAAQIVTLDKKYLPEAAFQVRNLDTTKSYSTEEVEEIYQSTRSGSAIYMTYGDVITNISYLQNTSFSFTLPSGQKETIYPENGVWDFSKRETTYPDAAFFNAQYSSYAQIFCDGNPGVGGFNGEGYELIETNMAGFFGGYIQAENAIVLKLNSASYYLYIKANKDGEIEVTKRKSGLTSGGDTTTLFKNGDDSMILKSSVEGSTKKFKITVDDSGTISATEVT